MEMSGSKKKKEPAAPSAPQRQIVVEQKQTLEIPKLVPKKSSTNSLANDFVLLAEGEVKMAPPPDPKIKFERCCDFIYRLWCAVLPLGKRLVAEEDDFKNGGVLLSKIGIEKFGRNAIFVRAGELGNTMIPGDLVLMVEKMPAVSLVSSRGFCTARYWVKHNDMLISIGKQGQVGFATFDDDDKLLKYLADQSAAGNSVYVVHHYLAAGVPKNGAATFIHSAPSHPLAKELVSDYVAKFKLQREKWGFIILRPESFITDAK